MRSRAASFLMRCLILPTALASVSFVCGCSDETHTTGTMVTRPPGADAARQRSIDSMKSIMKSHLKK
jgi:hypothetical protein